MRRYSHSVYRTAGLICDQTVIVTASYWCKAFKALLSRIRVKDPETHDSLIFFTSNSALSALAFIELRRCHCRRLRIKN